MLSLCEAIEERDIEAINKEEGESQWSLCDWRCSPNLLWRDPDECSISLDTFWMTHSNEIKASSSCGGQLRLCECLSLTKGTLLRAQPDTRTNW